MNYQNISKNCIAKKYLKDILSILILNITVARILQVTNKKHNTINITQQQQVYTGNNGGIVEIRWESNDNISLVSKK